MSNRLALLGEVARFESGGTPTRKKPDFYSGDHPWVTGADIALDGRITPRSHITDEAIRASSTKIVPAGTVLLVTRTSVGKVAVADRPLSFSQDITAIHPDERTLDNRYLVHLIKARETHFTRQARGATIKGVTREVVANLEVPLAPIEDQRRIATILDHADALIAKRRRSLEMHHEAAMSSLDAALMRVASKRVPLSTLAEVRIGPFGSLLHKEDYVDGGVPLVNPMHIVDGRIEANSAYTVADSKARSLAQFRLKAGDVVMGRRGEMGRCAVVGVEQDGFLCGTGSLIVRPRTGVAQSQYLQRVLSHRSTVRDLESRALGITLLNLNTKIMQNLMVPNASVEAQNAMEREVLALDRARQTLEAGLHELRQLAASLQARAFSGRL